MTAAEDLRKDPQEGAGLDPVDPGDLQESIVGIGPRTDFHTAAVRSPIADSHEHGLGTDVLPIENRSVGNRAEGPEFTQGGHEVAGAPVRPPHPVGALIDE